MFNSCLSRFFKHPARSARPIVEPPPPGRCLCIHLAPLGTPTTNATPASVRQVADQAAARAFLSSQGSKFYAPNSIPSQGKLGLDHHGF